MCADSKAVTHFLQLPFAEQLVLWAMRYWVVGYRRQVSVECRLLEAFAEVRAPAAAGLVDRIMRSLAEGHSRPVAINCTCCREVTGDERVILDLIARYQADDDGTTWFQLRRFLTPGATRIVGDLLCRLAGVMAGAGLVFARPLGLPRERACPAPPVLPSTRLH